MAGSAVEEVDKIRTDVAEAEIFETAGALDS